MVNEITRREIEEFVYREAALLDERKYEESDTGDMCDAQQRFFAPFSMAARRTETEDQKPGNRSQANTDHASQSAGEIGCHPAAGDELCRQDKPSHHDTRVRQHAYETDHEGRVRM